MKFLLSMETTYMDQVEVTLKSLMILISIVLKKLKMKYLLSMMSITHMDQQGQSQNTQSISMSIPVHFMKTFITKSTSHMTSMSKFILSLRIFLTSSLMERDSSQCQ